MLDVYMRVNTSPYDWKLCAGAIDIIVKECKLQDETPVDLQDMGIRMYVKKDAVKSRLDINANLHPYFIAGPALFFAIDSRGNFTSLAPAQVGVIVTWLRYGR